MHDSLRRAFTTDDKRAYRFKLGQIVASALSGFVVGVVTSTIIWMLAMYYINNLLLVGDGTAPSPEEILRNIGKF